LSVKGADVKLIFMMKKILLISAVLFVTITAIGQVKVLTEGNVAVGGNSVYNSSCKLQINDGGNNVAIVPDVGGANVGTDVWRLDFWHPKRHWNSVGMKDWSLHSDSVAKTDITPIKNATLLLKKIKTYSYFFKSDSIDFKGDSIDLRKRDYGVLAQEIKEVLPELVDSTKGSFLVRYSSFIGILIAGFNEQQALIEQQQTEIGILQNTIAAQELDIIELKTLQEAVKTLQEIVEKCCEKPKGGSSSYILDIPIEPQERAILYQNTPNPFSSNTEITCNLPATTQQAVIYIYNLQGVELKAYPLAQAGLNTITVYASELPAAMYLYTLVVDNEIIDTKRMILTK